MQQQQQRQAAAAVAGSAGGQQTQTMPQWEQFYQKEDLTTRLRNIIDEYPVGTGPFKEFLQNADDAAARRFGLCLDCGTYGTDSLLSSGLAAWQGPALVVFNSGVFSERDFASISNVGKSEKFEDAGKIGKYGLGFNVSYHFTDVPSFVSADQLVQFDPHAKHLPSNLPGLRAGFTTLPPAQCADQIAPFAAAAACFGAGKGQLAAASELRAGGFAGTIFRLPLRSAAQAAASEISGAHLQVDEIRQQLLAFGRELAAQSLIFLKHVEEVVIYELPAAAGEAPALLYSCSVVGSTPSLRAARTMVSDAAKQWPKHAGQASEADCTVTLELELATMLHTPGEPPLAGSERWRVIAGLAGGAEAEAAAASLNQLSWVGVAARVGGGGGGPVALAGRAYSFLPLPVATGLPLHVNAAFALTSNRRDLWRDGDDMAGAGAAKAAWNRHLLRNLGQTYATTLEAEALAADAEAGARGGGGGGYALWPDLAGALPPFDLTARAALVAVAEQGRRVFWDETGLIHRRLSEVAFDDPAFALLCRGEVELLALLAGNGLVVVSPPQFVRAGLKTALEGVKAAGARTVGVELLCGALRAAGPAAVAALGSSAAAAVLRYVLDGWEAHDAQRLGHLCGLPLLPLADGTRGTFLPSKQTGGGQCYYGLAAEYHGMFGPTFRHRLVDTSSSCFEQLILPAVALTLNVRPLDAVALADNLQHILPPGWRGREVVWLGAADRRLSGTEADRAAADAAEAAATKPAAVVVAEEEVIEDEDAWSRPGKGKKKRGEGGAKKKKKAHHQTVDAVQDHKPAHEAPAEDGPVDLAAVQQRLEVLWRYCSTAGLRAAEVKLLLGAGWPIVLAGTTGRIAGADSFEPQWAFSHEYAKRRGGILPKTELSAAEAKALHPVGILLLPPDAPPALIQAGTRRREVAAAAVVSFAAGPAAELGVVEGAALRALCLSWWRQSAGGFELPADNDGDERMEQQDENELSEPAVEGADEVLTSSTRFAPARAIHITPEMLRQLPLFSSRGLAFVAAEAADGDPGAVAAPSSSWDELLEKIADELLCVSAADVPAGPPNAGGLPGTVKAAHWRQLHIEGLDELLAVAGVHRTEELGFISRWLIPHFEDRKFDWFTEGTSLAILNAVSEQKLWRASKENTDAARVLRFCRRARFIAAGPSHQRSWHAVKEFVDPEDAIFSHVFDHPAARVTAPRYPPTTYQTPGSLAAMRACGLQSLREPAVFAKVAAAVKPGDVEAGRMLVGFFANTVKPGQGLSDWTANDWARILAIPWLPAYTLDPAALPPPELAPPPTASGLRALRRRMAAELAGGVGGGPGGGKKQKGKKFGKFGQGRLEGVSWDMDMDDGDSDFDSMEQADDISAEAVLREVEALLSKAEAGGGLSAPPDGVVAVATLISGRQCKEGVGAVLPTLGWTAWSATLVLDKSVEKLPPAILGRLGLPSRAPLKNLLGHLATVTAVWAAGPRLPAGGPVLAARQAAVVLGLLEVHEALLATPPSKRAEARQRAAKALGRAPLVLHEDGSMVRCSQVYVDLETDLGPTCRAPPPQLSCFYHLLQLLGAPAVPIDQRPEPTVSIDLNPVMILSSAGVDLLVGKAGGAGGGRSFATRHPLADVRVELSSGCGPLYCHSLVLSAGSDAFRAQLAGFGLETRTVCDGGPPVATLDLSAMEWATEPGVAALIGYLYIGEVEELGPSWEAGGEAAVSEATVVLACELLQLADHFLLERLKEVCEVYLAAENVVDVSNVCALLTHAASCNAPQLVAICRFYIVSMQELVTQTDEWAQLPEATKRMVV